MQELEERMRHERIGLALGSGGWKGLAHLGVLRALEELEIRPAVYAGASAGALFAAAAANRIQLGELETLAEQYRKRSLFRFDLGSLLRRGLGAPALFDGRPLRELCDDLLGNITFRELDTPTVISTVDIRTGALMRWGMGGRRDVPVADAVYASCAMPGFLPPGQVGSRLCMDGSVVDPLALSALEHLVDRIIVVDPGDPTDYLSDAAAAPRGSALWWRAQSIVMRDLVRHQLETWNGPPLVLVRPALRDVNILRARDPQGVILAGYLAARRVLADDDELDAEHSRLYFKM
jgi:NTE family protein